MFEKAEDDFIGNSHSICNSGIELRRKIFGVGLGSL
jgi:hypothetical protein